MVNPVIALKKIAFVRDHLKRLHARQGCTKEEFDLDRDLQDIVCFNLVQAIQGCADLANHIISDEGWGIPGSLREAANILVANGVVTKEQGDILQKMIGFRNHVVHEYSDIDLNEVFHVFRNHSDDISKILEAMIQRFGLE